MELTILNLVLITFVAGVMGGLVIAEQMDLETPERRRREQKRREASSAAGNPSHGKMRKITTPPLKILIIAYYITQPIRNFAYV